MLLLYTATVMPYDIALIDDSNIPMYNIDTCVDFMFMFDVLINFNSPLILENNKYNYNRK